MYIQVKTKKLDIFYKKNNHQNQSKSPIPINKKKIIYFHYVYKIINDKHLKMFEPNSFTSEPQYQRPDQRNSDI